MATPKMILNGRAVDDARTGTDKNGNPWMAVRVACSDSHQDDQDNWVTDRQLFVDVMWFCADTNHRVPQKGDSVEAGGRVHQTERTRESDGQVFKNFQMDARYIESWEKRQQSGGFGGQQGGGQDAWNSAPQGSGIPGGGSEPPF